MLASAPSPRHHGPIPIPIAANESFLIERGPKLQVATFWVLIMISMFFLFISCLRFYQLTII